MLGSATEEIGNPAYVASSPLSSEIVQMNCLLLLTDGTMLISGSGTGAILRDSNTSLIFAGRSLNVAGTWIPASAIALFFASAVSLSAFADAPA